MVIKYEFMFDQSHIIESMSRYRSQLSGSKFRSAFKVIYAILSLCTIAFGAISHDPFFIVFGVIVLLLLIFSRKILNIILLYRSKKSPFINNIATIAISEKGVECIDKISTTYLKWEAITKITHFPDGLLIFRGPNVFNWCPNNTLKEGNIEMALEFAKDNSIEIKHS